MDRFWDQKLLAVLEMPEEKVQLAIKILQTLSVAAAPLTFETFCEILVTDLGDECQSHCKRLLSDPNELLDLCSGLVEYSTVQVDSVQPEECPILLHPSMREYLFSDRTDTMMALASKMSIDESKANADMARTCITYLLHSKGTTLGYKDLISKYKFLPYAATFWDLHVKNIKYPLSSALKEQILELFTSCPTCFQTWLQVYDPDIQNEHPFENKTFPSPLYYASLLGYPVVVQALLDHGAKPDESRGKHRYPLLAAVENGHEAVVRVFLNNGADIEARYKNKDPALVRAVQKGHHATVALLIEHGANIDAPDKGGNTALHHAITYGRERQGHIKILQLLLNAGANINAKNQYGRTPLHQAVTHTGETTVQLLLDAGADIEAKDKDDETPLYHAAVGCEPAMQLLLTKGANTEAQNHHGSTPLLEAVARDVEAEVQMLLRAGADVHARDEKGWTALHFASANGSSNLAELLLQHGAIVHATAVGEETPLHLTVRRYHLPIVRILLANNVNVNAQDAKGRTALHIVSEPQEHGEPGSQEGTPQSMPEEKTREELVSDRLEIARVLVEQGADIHIKDSEGKSPMLLASSDERVRAEVKWLQECE